MATAVGPDIVTEGLVFGYDTNYGVADNATGTRFYPGKAVDNEFYNSGPDGTILDYVGYGGAGTAQSGALDPFGTTDNIVYRKTGKLRFGPTGGDDIGTLYYGNTYTFSIYMRHVPGETQMSGGEFDICDRANSKSYSGTLSSNMTYEWKRFSVTALHNNSSNYHFIDVGIYQGTGVFEWCCPQIELGTIASPFTNTERTSTQSLIDLKETTDIDLSNVSFNSTGQPTFDGTDDIIDLTLPKNFQDKLTIETWYKGTDSSRNHLWNFTGSGNLNCNFNDGSYTLWLYWDGGGSNYLRFTTPQFCDSEIHHIVFVHEGSTNKVYLDGVLLTNGVAGGTQTFNLKIGSTYDVGGSPYFQGDVYVNRVYDKALTATEVKQNYNTYKNRFDI